jgi:hypothetical protein
MYDTRWHWIGVYSRIGKLSASKSCPFPVNLSSRYPAEGDPDYCNSSENQTRALRYAIPIDDILHAFSPPKAYWSQPRYAAISFFSFRLKHDLNPKLLTVLVKP